MLKCIKKIDINNILPNGENNLFILKLKISNYII